MLIAQLGACSLLFSYAETESDAGAFDASTGTVDADLNVFDAGLDEMVFNFEAGRLAPWIEGEGAACAVVTDPHDLTNRVLCCSPDAPNQDSFIHFGFEATRNIEMTFRTLQQTTPQGAFSPMAGFNDSGTVNAVVIANLNTLSDLALSVASIDGAGAVGSPPIGSFSRNEWIDVQFAAHLDAPCPEVSITLPTSEDSSSLTLTTTVLRDINTAILGVFREASSSGTNSRCFDDITIRRNAPCSSPDGNDS